MRTKEEIRKARTDAGLTQREAAELVGVSLGQWEHYEAGRRNMRERIWKLFEERIRERARIQELEARGQELETMRRALVDLAGGER